MLSLKQKEQRPPTSGVFRCWSVLLAPVDPTWDVQYMQLVLVFRDLPKVNLAGS